MPPALPQEAGWLLVMGSSSIREAIHGPSPIGPSKILEDLVT